MSSDAVAGMVNVILKRDYQGDQVRLRGGTASDSFDVSRAHRRKLEPDLRTAGHTARPVEWVRSSAAGRLR